MSLKCIIIDDEPSSQKVLELFVSKLDFLKLEGVCHSALEAMEFLKTNPVDLLFLDINMPHLSGLSFYKSLQNPPLVIFTTAYSEYALDGFEVNATDYLLKPFSFERFVKAVTRARNILSDNLAQENITIKADKKLYQVKFSDLLFVEALGDYIKINLKNKTLVTYKTLSNIKSSLPENMFLQIHKSYIVNTKFIDYIEGNQVIIQDNKIPIGQKFKADFLSQIKS